MRFAVGIFLFVKIKGVIIMVTFYNGADHVGGRLVGELREGFVQL